MHVVASLVEGTTPRTRQAVAALAAVTGVPAGMAPVLVVASVSDQVTWLSLRNARGVHLLDEGQLNTYDVLVSDHVVFTQAALDSFVARSTGTTVPDAADDTAADTAADDTVADDTVAADQEGGQA